MIKRTPLTSFAVLLAAITRTAEAVDVPREPQTATLEEVVVTAERRDINLQETPLAISAFTAAQRNLKGLSSIQDVANFTPGMAYSASADRTSMRGLTRLVTSFTADSAIAVYHDDLYTTRTVLLGLSDLFVDRIEIQRGPQGTLYGRNAIGGVIRTVSRLPTQDWSGEVRAQLGNYQRWSLEGTVAGPITDDLGVRVSGSRTVQDEGYFDNLANGSSEGGIADDWYANAMLQWEPTDRDRLWLNVYGYGWNNASSGAGALLGIPEVGPYDTDLRNFSTFDLTFNPNFGHSPLSGFATGAAGGAPLGQALGPIAGSVVGPTNLTQNPALQDIRKLSRAIRTDVDITDAYTVGLQYKHSFDSFDAKYVGGYSQYRFALTSSSPSGGNSGITSYQIPLNPAGLCATGALGPCNPLTVYPAHRLDSSTDDDWTSHELVLTGTKPGPLQWIAGLAYFSENYGSPTTVSLPNQPQIFNPAFAVDAFGVASPGSAPNPSGAFSYNDYNFRTTSTALYAQLDWAVTSEVTLTAGLRYTEDHKWGVERHRIVAFSDRFGAVPGGHPSDYLGFGDLTAENFGANLPALDLTQAAISGNLFTSGEGVACLPYRAADGAYERCLDGKSDAVTGTAGVQWTPAEDLLVYLRYNRGYKALGFNAGFMTSHPLAAPEFLDDYEIGLKQTVGSNFQYSVALFHYDYRDLQAPVWVHNGFTRDLVFFNIPESTARGVEFQADWITLENLQLSFSYAFNDSEIDSGCNLVGGVASGACFIDALDLSAVAQGAQPVATTASGDVLQSVKGNVLPQASRHRVALNATYTWSFTAGTLALSGNYVWRDRAYSGIFQRNYNEAPAWDQVDVRATWRDQSQRYSIIGFVRNVLDTEGYVAAIEGTRTYNGSYFPSGYNRIFELTPPRTYGVELQYRF